MNPIIREQRWSKRTWQSFFHTNIAFLFFVHRRFIDKGCRDSRINQSRLIPRKKTIVTQGSGKFRVCRNRYLLVAVRSPDHHGLFVDDLTGGDGVDLLDVLDLGNGLHVVYIYLFDRVYLWRLSRLFMSFGKFFLLFLDFFRRVFVVPSFSPRGCFFFYFRKRGNQIDDAEPNLRHLSSTMTRSRKETQGKN